MLFARNHRIHSSVSGEMCFSVKEDLPAGLASAMGRRAGGEFILLSRRLGLDRRSPAGISGSLYVGIARWVIGMDGLPARGCTGSV